MKILRFNESKSSKQITIYRVVSVNEGERLSIDTTNVGKYFFRNVSDIDTSVLKKQGDQFFIIKAITEDSNIDENISETESEKLGCKCCVIKNPELVSIEEIKPMK